MKRCPQCNTVFEAAMLYCKEDGTPLVNEALPMPSDFSSENGEGEQETIVRNHPITVEIPHKTIPEPQPTIPQQPQVNPYAPNHANYSQPVPPAKNRGCLKYTLILLIGLVIGGGIVLAILGIGFAYMNQSANTDPNSNAAKTVEKTPVSESKNNSVDANTNKHSKPNSQINDAKLNGRIIKDAANLRSNASSRAKKIDTLPLNDRIEIVQRKSSTSKWYEIECEHGSRGWIDGYSIEFTE